MASDAETTTAAADALGELRAFYRDRRVLVTGSTGFKGSWLCLWLSRLGADVAGLGLEPDQGPDNLFERAAVEDVVPTAIVDVRDQEAVAQAVERHQPTVIFHLAARALVQQGYADPVGTIAVNTLGTAIVLEAARGCPAVGSVLCVTTDKVYLNLEWPWPYREADELGGHDAYSASKAGAELVARAYGAALQPADRRLAIATARGGNVVGGSDWSAHRLVPDVVRAIRDREPLRLRYPRATRPWQHVLDVNYAYLLLGARLTRSPPESDLGSAWNVGPALDCELSVGELATLMLEAMGAGDLGFQLDSPSSYEAIALRVDPSRTNHRLGWRPALDAAATIRWTAEWYRRYLDDSSSARALCDEQLARYEEAIG